MQVITKALFEHYVPAFRTPGGEDESTVWDALRTHLATAVGAVTDRYGTIPESADTEAARLICIRAARTAMAGADLVLTPTGFGVVSNQNLAPASRERVGALAEELRREESRADDALAARLLRDPAWCTSAAAVSMVDSLLWCPTLMRRYGVTAPGRAEVYAREYAALLPRLREAEVKAARIISPELMERLILGERTSEDAALPQAYALATEHTRRFMAALLMAETYPHAVREAARALTDLLHRHADTLTEYAGSAVRQAEEAPRYENQKTDPSFFFA